MENQWKTKGKPQEKRRKTKGKLKENQSKTKGKPKDNQRKTKRKPKETVAVGSLHGHHRWACSARFGRPIANKNRSPMSASGQILSASGQTIGRLLSASCPNSVGQWPKFCRPDQTNPKKNVSRWPKLCRPDQNSFDQTKN